MRPKIPSPATKSPIWWLVDHLHLFIFLGSTMEMALKHHKTIAFSHWSGPLRARRKSLAVQTSATVAGGARPPQRAHTVPVAVAHLRVACSHRGRRCSGNLTGELEISLPVRGPIGLRGNTQDVEMENPWVMFSWENDLLNGSECSTS